LIAQSIASIKVLASTGFRKKYLAPHCLAWRRVRSSSRAETMMMVGWIPRSLRRFCISSPLMRGMVMSSTTQASGASVTSSRKRSALS